MRDGRRERGKEWTTATYDLLSWAADKDSVTMRFVSTMQGPSASFDNATVGLSRDFDLRRRLTNAATLNVTMAPAYSKTATGTKNQAVKRDDIVIK